MIDIESHTADIRIRLKAGSIAQLFSEGMRSLYEVLEPGNRKGKGGINQSIRLKGTDKTILLINFLNEVLSHSLIHKCVFDKMSRFEKHNDALFIDIQGFQVNGFIKDIKAVTFHEAEIQKSETGEFSTTIILDI
jgi:SHS2 domain-containing protein